MNQIVIGLCGRKGAGKDTAADVLVEAGWARIAFADPLYHECATAFGVSREFLNFRETKELPMPRLRLAVCADKAYIASVVATFAPKSIRNQVLKLVAALQPRHGPLDPDSFYEEGFVSIWQFPPATTKSSNIAATYLKKFLQKARSPRVVLQWWGTEYRRNTCGPTYFTDKLVAAIRTQPNTSFVVPDVRFKNEDDCLDAAFGAFLARVTRPALEQLDDATMAHPSEQQMRNIPVDFHLINEEGEAGKQALVAQVRAMLKAVTPQPVPVA